MAPPQQQPDIAGALARGQIDPIYCLSGEPYLVEATAAAIRATVNRPLRVEMTSLSPIESAS